MDFPDSYGPRPPWHDIQAEVRGAAVHDLEHTFRERWYGSSVLDLPSPVRQLYDRAYHMGATTSRPLPEPVPDESMPRGTHAVQVLRTYPARLRRYPFAPHGERSIAHAYRKAFARARSLVYLEDQYFWSRPVAALIASALRAHPGLHVIAVVPRYPDNDGPVTRMPGLIARHDVVRACAAAGGDRFAVYDLENHQGTPVYVHAKIVVVDDVWAMVGSDNLNRRSWSHDSELSIGVLDAEPDPREPRDPAGLGDGARVFARDLRLRLCREHLDRDPDDVADLLDPRDVFAAFRRQAQQLAAWHDRGGAGEPAAGAFAASSDLPAYDRAAVLVEAAVPPGLRPGRPAAARPGARPSLTAAVRGQPPGRPGRLLSNQRLIGDQADPRSEGWWDMRSCRSLRRGRVSLAAGIGIAAVFCAGVTGVPAQAMPPAPGVSPARVVSLARPAPLAGRRTAASIAVSCHSQAHPKLAARLARGIHAALQGRASAVALRVEDRSEDLGCFLNTTAHFDSASVVKVEILGTLLREAETQHRSLTAAETRLARLMITQSDNDAASDLWAHVGRGRLRYFLGRAADDADPARAGRLLGPDPDHRAR